MRTIVGVVSRLGVLDEPLAVASSVVEHDVHNPEEAELISEAAYSATQEPQSLLAREPWGLEEAVVDRGLVSQGVVRARLAVLLDGREMHRVVAELRGI